MPRVSDEYRARRRDEIAQAMLRCVARQGLARTSMADVIAESGLSAGAIYSHFSSKAEIAQHLGLRVAGQKFDEVVAALPDDASPREVIRALIESLDARGVPPAAALQVWAEATVDEGMREVVAPVLASIITLLEGHFGRTRSLSDARALADGVSAMVQGYIVRRGIDPTMTAARYLEGIDALLAPSEPPLVPPEQRMRSPAHGALP